MDRDGAKSRGPRLSAALPRVSVALITPAFDRGGLEQVVLNLYRGYRRAGCDCIVMVETNQAGYLASFVADEDDVFVFDGNEKLFLGKLYERRVNVVHYNYTYVGLSALKAIGVFTVYTLHSVYTWLDGVGFERCRSEVLQADEIVAVSTYVRDYFRRRARLESRPIRIIQNGVDVEALDAGAERLRRSDLDLPEDVHVFAHVGSFFRNKHQAVTIRAGEILAARGRDFRLLLVGNVGDAVLHQELVAMLSRSPARDRVRLVDFISRERMKSFYRDIVDVVLLPSLQEGCSNVVLEALVFGKPLVLTDVGNARDAAALSSAVSIIPPAYADVHELDERMIDRLSRTGDTLNAEPLADAMEAWMGEVVPGATRTADPDLRRSLATDAMVAAYLDIFANRRDVLFWPDDGDAVVAAE